MPGRFGPALMVTGGLVTVVGIAAALAFATGVTTRPSTPPSDAPITVVTVIEGDTLDVARAGQQVRVRLLNVDAPDTLTPDHPECGGAEAAAWLEQRLPPGTVVTLAHDQEAQDGEGHELAWVTAPDGGVVNVELARQGWAQAVSVEPNHTHYSEVAAAQAEAKAAGVGLYDVKTECTLPAQVARQVSALAGALETAVDEKDSDLVAALNGTAVVQAALARAADTVEGRMLGSAEIARLQDELRRADAAARAGQARLAEESKAEAARQAAEEEAARRAADEAAREEAAAREAEARRQEEERRRAEEQTSTPTPTDLMPSSDAPTPTGTPTS